MHAHIVQTTAAVIAVAAARDGRYDHMVANAHIGPDLAADLLGDTGNLMSAIERILFLHAGKIPLLKCAQPAGFYADEHFIFRYFRYGRVPQFHGFFRNDNCFLHIIFPQLS